MSFLSGFAGLAGLLPGYINGRRQAIQDNWADLKNYNDTKAGQINNLWSEATFPLDFSRAWDNTQMSNWATDLAGQNYALNKMIFPTEVFRTMLQLNFGPQQDLMKQMLSTRMGLQLLANGGFNLGQTKAPSIG